MSLPSEITFVDVRKRFDFKSIAIGRWVTRSERERSAEQFYRALVNLMTVLSCPEHVISLRGNLSFQYGIGGRPGVAAHYDPSQRCFSLAKNAGPGSIAHEWFHALDHYLVTKVFVDAPADMFASKAWLNDATPQPHALNDKFYQCLKSVLLSPNGHSPSVLFSQSALLDKQLKTRYYSLPEELCARAFEVYVQDKLVQKNIVDPFLVSRVSHSEEAKLGLYPRLAQRQAINSAFDSYFSALGRVLKNS